MKTINQITKALLVIAILLLKSTIIYAQNETEKQKKQQTTVKYPEAKLVYGDVHGAKQEELQGQLQLALGDNNIEELRVLIKKGANTNKLPGNTDMTPLMLAETQEIATLLLENGANPLVTDVNGQNLLHYAVSKENALDLISLYVSLEVDVNSLDLEKNTPLTLVIMYFEETNAFNSAPVLVGGENNDSDEKLFKPNPIKILKALVVAGADKTIQNQHGETAKDIANKIGRKYIYQLLD